MKTTLKVKTGIKGAGIGTANHNRSYLSTLTPEQRRELSSKGGKAAQSSGRGRRWTPEEARAAGVKGAEARARYARERAAQEAGA